jgi:hypothetical protein
MTRVPAEPAAGHGPREARDRFPDKRRCDILRDAPLFPKARLIPAAVTARAERRAGSNGIVASIIMRRPGRTISH